MATAAKHVATLSAGTDAWTIPPGEAGSMTMLCRIKLTIDEVEPCPEGACPFWEHGGAVIDAGCGLERLPIELDRTDVARHFVELRRALERARDEREREDARRAFAALVPPELSGR